MTTPQTHPPLRIRSRNVFLRTLREIPRYFVAHIHPKEQYDIVLYQYGYWYESLHTARTAEEALVLFQKIGGVSLATSKEFMVFPHQTPNWNTCLNEWIRESIQRAPLDESFRLQP